MKESNFFFLGNVFHHISHALPLYKKVGGTFIVISESIYNECKKLKLPVLMLDSLKDSDNNSEFMPHHVPVTIDFLNRQSGWIFFFESYNIVPALHSLKKVMLFHGISLKTSWFLPSRIAILHCFDFITALGPYQESLLLEYSVDHKKLWKVGQGKNDSIINSSDIEKKNARNKVQTTYPGDYKKIFTYFPTFWGNTTVDNLGLDVVKNIAEDFLLIIKLHGNTPRDIVDQYTEIGKSRKNIIVYFDVLEGQLSNLELLRASDAFFVDVSSMTFEALLTKKPLIFLVNQKNVHYYDAIAEIFGVSLHIGANNINRLNHHLNNFESTVNDYDQAWNNTTKRIFYNLDGKALKDFCSHLKKYDKSQDKTRLIETLSAVKRNESLILNLQQTANEARYLSYKTYEFLTEQQNKNKSKTLSLRSLLNRLRRSLA